MDRLVAREAHGDLLVIAQLVRDAALGKCGDGIVRTSPSKVCSRIGSAGVSPSWAGTHQTFPLRRGNDQHGAVGARGQILQHRMHGGADDYSPFAQRAGYNRNNA